MNEHNLQDKHKSPIENDNLFSECSVLEGAEEIDRDLRDTFYSVQNTKLYDDLRERTQQIIGSNKETTQNDKCEMLINAMKKYLELETKDLKKTKYREFIVIGAFLVIIGCFLYAFYNKAPF